MPPLVQPPGGRSDDIWEQHRSTLRQLYQVERKKLVDIKTIMERDYEFPATPLSTYESKLRQMRLRKKLKKTDWHAVYQELQRRGERNSAVYLCGTKIPSANAWKEIRRSGARSSHDGQQRQLPPEVVVRTPSPGRRSPPLSLVFRNRNNNSSHGIISSQLPPVTLQQTAHPPLYTRIRSPNEMSVLDLPSASSDFQKVLLQHLPTYVLKLELSRFFEESSIIRSMAHSDHLDLEPDSQLTGRHVGFYSNSSVPNLPTLGLTIKFRHLLETVHMLANQHSSGSDETRLFDELFAYFPLSMLISLLAINSRCIQVVFEKVLRYLFRRDRRDDFQVLVEAIAHDHPYWLTPAIAEYIFYAATMNCLHACQLLLEICKVASPQDIFLARMLMYDLQDWLKGEHRHYDAAIFAAVSAGYVDCARLIIEHIAQNCPLPQGYDRDTTLSSCHPEKHGVRGHNFEYPGNQVTCLFFHAIFIIRSGLFWSPNLDYEIMPLRIPFRFEMEAAQHAFDIFIEFGLNVDSLTPSWLNGKSIENKFVDTEQRCPDLFGWDCEALLVSDLYVDFKTPIHLRPTVLDVTYNLNKEIFHYLARYSKKAATQLTRSGLYLAAESGRDHLSRYLDASCSRSSDVRELLEMILAEQFIVRFDLDVAHTLLERGIGFGAFPQDLNLSLPLGRLVATIKQQGIKPEILSIFNQLLIQGAVIDADVMAVAVECRGTDLLKVLSGYSADFATCGTVALVMAAMLDNYEAVDWLLEAGVDINAGILFKGKLTTVVSAFAERVNHPFPTMTQRPASPYDLYFSVWAQELDGEALIISMLKYLVGRGASLCPHPGNSQPNSLLLHAITTGKHRKDILDIITYILAAQGGFHNTLPSQPCLLEVCFLDHGMCGHTVERDLDCGLPIFNLLLTSGIPLVNSGVLSLLIKYGAAIDLIQMVIDSGVNVNTYSGRGTEENTNWEGRCTPLQAAAGAGRLELVKNLVHNGAKINLPGKGRYGGTALQAACGRPTSKSGGERSTKTALVQFLIVNGADVNAPAAPVEGRTALQAAASSGDIETAMVLLNHGADINAPPSGEDGWCALDAAVCFGRLDMTKFLLDLGALSWERGENGLAGALELAEERGYWAVADLIRERAMLCTQIRSALEENGC